MSDRREKQYKIWSDKICLGIQPLSSSSLTTFASSCAQRACRSFVATARHRICLATWAHIHVNQGKCLLNLHATTAADGLAVSTRIRMLNRDNSSQDRDASNLCRFFFELALFAFFSSWPPFNTTGRLFCCTGHGRTAWECTQGVSGCHSSLQRQSGESKFDLQWPVAKLIHRCSFTLRTAAVHHYQRPLSFGNQ